MLEEASTAGEHRPVRQPLVGVAVVYGLGIALGATLPAAWWFWVGVSFVATGVFFCVRAWQPVVWVWVVASAGAVSYQATAQVHDPWHVVRLLERPTSESGSVRLVRRVTLRGVVLQEPVGRSGCFLQVESVLREETWIPASGRVWVSVAGGHGLRMGDVVELTGSVRMPRPPRNPGQFDWAGWLEQRRVWVTVWVGPQDRLDVTGRAARSWWWTWSVWLRERLVHVVGAGLEDVPAVAGMLRGMLLGERTEIPEEDHRAFQRAGVFHVFAVSGLHVGLVTATVVLGLQLARVPLRWCGLVAVPVVILYVLATGARPGAVRAMWMACAWLIGWSWGRLGNLWNVFGFAALVILVADPLQLFDGGFQLSFVVVAALLALTPRLEGWIWRRLGPDPLVPRELWPRWWQWGVPAGRFLVRLVAGSVAAWVGLVPLMAVYFHLFTPLALLANVVVVPVLGLIMGLGIASMVTSPLGTVLAVGFNNANYLLVEAVRWIVEGMVRFVGGYWYVQAPHGAWIAAYYGALVTGLRWRLAWWSVPVVMVGMFAHEWLSPKVEITVLDTARGGAVFVNVPGEREDWLLDGGDEAAGRRVVLPFLRWAGVDRLGGMALTRADKNHAEGLSVVACEVPVERAWHAGYWTRSEAYQRWLERMREQGANLEKARAPMGRTLSGGVQLRVLHPRDGMAPRRSEDAVVVLGLEYQQRRVVLLSDASTMVLEQIVEEVEAYRPEVIVQGSDGARWETMKWFLERVRPRVAVLAQPPTTRFHPRRRLEGWAGELYRTDDTGAVVVAIDARGVSVRTWVPSGR